MRRWPRPWVTCSWRAAQRTGQRAAGGQRRGAVVAVVQHQRRQRHPRAQPVGPELLHADPFAARSPLHALGQRLGQAQARPRTSAETAPAAATARSAPGARPTGRAPPRARPPARPANARPRRTTARGAADAENSARTHCGSVARAPSLAPCAGRSSSTGSKPAARQRLAERAHLLGVAGPAVRQQHARAPGGVAALPADERAAFEAVPLRLPVAPARRVAARAVRAPAA